jgi:hypothetical protein
MIQVNKVQQISRTIEQQHIKRRPMLPYGPLIVFSPVLRLCCAIALLSYLNVPLTI